MVESDDVIRGTEGYLPLRTAYGSEFLRLGVDKGMIVDDGKGVSVALAGTVSTWLEDS